MRPPFWRLGRFALSSIALGLAMAAVLLFLFPQLRHDGSLIDAVRSWRQEPVGSYASAVRVAAPAVVNIYTRSLQSGYNSNGGGSSGLGSGVIITSQGHILTNNHVIAGADMVLVALQDGRTYSATFVGADTYTDLAVLQIEADNLPVIPQNQDLHPQVGDIVLALGNPYNLGLTITQGIISGTGRIGMATGMYKDFLQTDAAINAGNSGGALVNSRGELVGINTAVYHTENNQEIQSLSFAVPYALAHKVMLQLIAHGYVSRGYLGLTGETVSRVNYTSVGQGEQLVDAGVRVSSMDPNGPAAKAGIKNGDIIVRINKTPVLNLKQGLDMVAEHAPNSTVNVWVIRDNQSEISIPVVLGELPRQASPQ